MVVMAVVAVVVVVVFSTPELALGGAEAPSSPMTLFVKRTSYSTVAWRSAQVRLCMWARQLGAVLVTVVMLMLSAYATPKTFTLNE